MSVRYTVIGDSIQLVECTLEPGEELYAASGRLRWKSITVDMHTSIGAGDRPPPPPAEADAATVPRSGTDLTPTADLATDTPPETGPATSSHDPTSVGLPSGSHATAGSDQPTAVSHRPGWRGGDTSQPDGSAGEPATSLFGKGLHLGRTLSTTAVDAGKRALAGEGLAMQWFRSTAGQGSTAGHGTVAFGGNEPGQVVPIVLTGSTGWLAGHGAFLCAERSITYTAVLCPIRSGLEGGEGMALGHLQGSGLLVLTSSGVAVEVDLAKYGGSLQIHSGAVVGFEDTVTYGVERVGTLNADGMLAGAVGGEGFYLFTLAGQGRVVLQSGTAKSITSSLARTGLGKLAHGI